MTIAERNNKLKYFITCLKCEVSGKCCDLNCSTQYDAGNMGEIIENLEAISKALEQEPKNCEDCEIVQGCIEAGIRATQKALEQEPILDRIRAEIDKIYEREGSSFDCLNALDELKEFIDKCKAESESKE